MDGLHFCRPFFKEDGGDTGGRHFFLNTLRGDAGEVRSTLWSAVSGSARRLHLYCYGGYAIYVGYVAHTQNPNAMYDKGKFHLPLWYDGPANLMPDIVKRRMC